MRTCAREWCSATFPVAGKRKYCSHSCTHNRTWSNRKDAVCARDGCEEQFAPNRIGQPRKYCSPECSAAGRRHPKIDTPAVCATPGCQQPPKGTRRDARYCSASCRERNRYATSPELRRYHMLRMKEGRAARTGRSLTGRQCPTCGVPISKDAHALRRFCSIECKEAARDTEKRRAAFKARYDRNPGPQRAETARRRALKRNSVLVCETPTVDILKSGPCVYCGAPSEDVDHVRPLSRGGVHHESNLVPACMRCNRGKHSKLLTEWDSERVARAVKRSRKVRAEWKRLALGQEAMF